MISSLSLTTTAGRVEVVQIKSSDNNNSSFNFIIVQDKIKLLLLKVFSSRLTMLTYPGGQIYLFPPQASELRRAACARRCLSPTDI